MYHQRVPYDSLFSWATIEANLDFANLSFADQVQSTLPRSHNQTIIPDGGDAKFSTYTWCDQIEIAHRP